MPKACLLVDITDVYYRLKKQYDNGKLNFSYLLEQLRTEGYEIEEAIAYGCQTDHEASSFIGFMKSIGFTTRYKHPYILKINGRQIKRCNWTTGIAVDAFRAVDKVDTIIICSSNPDLLPLLKYLKDERGKEIVLLTVNPPANMEKASSKVMSLDETFLEE